jgi:hypothetical protein
MSNIKKLNDMRIYISSFSKICKLEKIIKFDSKLNSYRDFELDNTKTININNFELEINQKKFKYSTYYTNPFFLSSNDVNSIKFKKTKNKLVEKLSNKIFKPKTESKFDIESKFEKIHIYELNILLTKKNKFIDKYIGLEHTLLILWYLVYLDKNISFDIKQIYFNLILNYYTKFISDTFDFNEIIYGVINSQNIFGKKFYVSFYILAEEFHLKYIYKYLKSKSKSNIIFNSNYTKINPQTILNDFNGELKSDINSINCDISNPYGHNLLLIKTDKNKIYYYDPDEQINSELYKFKSLFKLANLNFLNISNRKPIQTITDDSNCVFYCVGFIKYLIQNNIKFELDKLKLATLLYESFILSNNCDIFKFSIDDTICIE